MRDLGSKLDPVCPPSSNSSDNAEADYNKCNYVDRRPDSRDRIGKVTGGS